MRNIAEHFLSPQQDQVETGIFCTYCDVSPVPAAKSCLHCEASLCDSHLMEHSKSPEHILTEPTTSPKNRKCSIHKKVLVYYCYEDVACICLSCCLDGEHREHHVEPLNEASEKGKLRKILEELTSKREETERQVQRLLERRKEVQGKAVAEAKRVTALIRDIREQLGALERRVLGEIHRWEEQVSLSVSDLILNLETKKDELTRNILYIEELYKTSNQITVLWDRAELCGTEEGDNEDRERGDKGVPTVVDLEEDFICVLHTGLIDIVTDVKRKIHGQDGGNDGTEREDKEVPSVGDLDKVLISGTSHTELADIRTDVTRFIVQEARDMLLDVNTAGNYVDVSHDRKTAFSSFTERFQYDQVLSTKMFNSAQHYWEVEGSESGWLMVGVAYPSIERQGPQSQIGYNKKSWCLLLRDEFWSVIHDSIVNKLAHKPSCRKIRISLDYEAGRLSFYELCHPDRHLHTFTATFTEPLHAAFCVHNGASVTILS